MRLQINPQPKYTIWIDQDSVLYDLETPWFRMHNNEHPNHQIDADKLDQWNLDKLCASNGCNANLYSYLDNKAVWEVGGVIGNSQEIILGWKRDNIAKVGVLTTAISHVSPSLKMQWLENHFNFIDRVAIVSGIRKSELRGDILIDDSPLNILDWPGIGILYTQPTNMQINRLRANTWDEVNTLVRISIILLDQGYAHKEIESLLFNRQEHGEKNDNQHIHTT